MKRITLIVGCIAALSWFSPLTQAADSELGISFCIDDYPTKVYTNGCGVRIGDKAEVFFTWKAYVAYKYKHMKYKNIHVTHIERDMVGNDRAIAIYYEREVNFRGDAPEPDGACRFMEFGCPTLEPEKEY